MSGKKGQTHNKYSSELKREILDRYFKNHESSIMLGKEYNISYKTIENWVTKTKRGKDVISDNRKEHSGNRKKELTLEDVLQENDILKKMEKFVSQHREKKLSSLTSIEKNTH